MKIWASLTGSAGGSPALNAERSNRSAADPAAVRGAGRLPMSALRAQCENHPVSRNGRHSSFVRRGALLAPVSR
jgi:hypothetical protein